MNPVYQETLDAINAATAGMDEQQLLYHPEGKWSSAQILEHLALAFGSTCKMMERALEAGKSLGDTPTIKQRLQAFIVTGVGYFPEGRQAPMVVAPKGEWGGMEALEKIRANLIALDKLQTECLAKVGAQGWLGNHPVLGPLTIYQWPRFHRVHTRHHMKQVRERKLAQQK